MRWHRTTPLAPDTTKWSAGEGQRVHNATPLSRDAGEGQGVRGLCVTFGVLKRSAGLAAHSISPPATVCPAFHIVPIFSPSFTALCRYFTRSLAILRPNH